MPPRAFRLEDLFASNAAPDVGTGDPNDPVTDPNVPPPPPPDNGPTTEIGNPPTELPPGDIFPGGTPPPPLEQGPDGLPTPITTPSASPLDTPSPVLTPAASPTSPSSATAPGSFADPGSSSARPLQPFNYRSLFDPRNRVQGSLAPGSRVPVTPANIAPESGTLGGQSESAITRALRRLRG